jgi:hypothetical protein
MKHPIYLGYGLLMLALTGVSQYRGWSLSSVNQERIQDPKSIRDNPGSYRSHYGYYSRHVGGK